MIYVERTSAPDFFSSERVEEEKRRVDQSFSKIKSLDALRESRYKFNASIWLKAKPALTELFHGKCAFCESPSAIYAHGDIEHFRPKLRAMGLDGTVSLGYWWLAYEWSNLYLVCQFCNQSKSSRFPVHGRRAAYGEDVRQEQALLLDPCHKPDFDERHFLFGLNDQLRQVDMVGNTERGEVTINVLGLNRIELQESRYAEVEKARTFLLALGDPSVSDATRAALVEVLLASVQSQAPFVAATREILQGLILERRDLFEAEAPALMEAFVDADDVLDTNQRETLIAQKKEARKKVDFSVYDTGKAAKEQYYGSLKRITRVEIENFKAVNLSKLHSPQDDGEFQGLDLTKQHEAPESWLMLIGENATGKSTVLQAIALALMGREKRDELSFNATDFLKRGASTWRVAVHLSNMPEPITLSPSEDDPEAFASNDEQPKVLILGYGSTRLLRSADDPVSDARELVRIKNLFDPFEKLNNVIKWVADTEKVSTKKFNLIKEALYDLLFLDPETNKIDRREGTVYITQGGERISLERLSDGFRTLAVLALDIMMVLSEKWKTIEDAEGIVLIDEIGLHLHPRWKMQITKKFKKIFPAMQFIVTTHEPLCLRGLVEGQVVVMKRDENNEIEVVQDLPSPSDFRVDQLLASEFFGLSSIVDPDVEMLFNDYYRLMANDKLTEEESRELEELKEQLKGRKHLGNTLREELMYEAIDKVLADKKHRRPHLMLKDMKAEVVQQIADIWQSTVLGPEGE